MFRAALPEQRIEVGDVLVRELIRPAGESVESVPRTKPAIANFRVKPTQRDWDWKAQGNLCFSYGRVRQWRIPPLFASGVFQILEVERHCRANDQPRRAGVVNRDNGTEGAPPALAGVILFREVVTCFSP